MLKNFFQKNTITMFLLIFFTICWLFFYLNCIDETDWWIENILVFLGVTFLFFNRYVFTFRDISYICICCFMLLHIYGARYAYTQNIVGEWLQNRFQLGRNPYDRIVHFSFGFLLYIPVLDYLKNKIKVCKKYQFFLTLNIILSLACIFELLEWLVAAIATKETGETFVATQGDVWDAHKDIVLALLGGAITGFLIKWLKRSKKNTYEFLLH